MARAILVFALITPVLVAPPANAQFIGPSQSGREMTVEQARAARIDSYVVVTGSIVAHLREDYFTFRDQSGEIRVEIEDGVWGGRQVGPNDKVRLLAEVDRNSAGTVYLWVERLDVLK